MYFSDAIACSTSDRHGVGSLSSAPSLPISCKYADALVQEIVFFSSKICNAMRCATWYSMFAMVVAPCFQISPFPNPWCSPIFFYRSVLAMFTSLPVHVVFDLHQISSQTEAFLVFGFQHMEMHTS